MIFVCFAVGFMQDLVEIFSKEYDIDDATKRGKTICAYATEGNHNVLRRILKHFDPKVVKLEMFKKWTYDKDGILIGTWGSLKSQKCIMEIMNYFRDDKKYVKKMMLQMDEEKEHSMITKSFSDDKENIKLQEFLLNDMQIKIQDILDFTKLEVNSIRITFNSPPYIPHIFIS